MASVSTEEKKSESMGVSSKYIQPYSVNPATYVPYSESVKGLLTDLYQITMTYAYWKNGDMEKQAVFDLFFRKCPFKGEFCIFAGLDDVLRFLNTFSFTDNDIKHLKMTFPTWDAKFWEYLRTVDGSTLVVYAQREGSVVFPKIPLLRIEGPLAICQLVETTLLNLVNYPSLLTTNAARIRNAAGDNASLLEFGLRRAQGPDGAMSASRYAYMGGFDGTSNVLAGLTYSIPIKGTHAHSFVSSFTKIEELKKEHIKISINKNNNTRKIKYDSKIHDNFISRVLYYRNKLKCNNTNSGELAAFIAYACAFPNGFLALIDTYDTLTSGVLNFLCVSLALYIDYGYNPIGIRLDSGDLAYLSNEVRKKFILISKEYNVPFSKLNIVASNDINEEVLESLNQQGHSINSFGIGTHLVTCKRQPALGCVYKLVEIDGKSRIKVSQEIDKMTIPSKKLVYRLFDSNNTPVLDLMVSQYQQPSFEKNEKSSNDNDYVKEHKEILCMHPFLMSKRCSVKPTKVESLLIKVWDKKCVYDSPSLKDTRLYCRKQINMFRHDYLRSQNPTPYKVSVSRDLKNTIQELWTREVPMKVFE